MPKFRGIVRDVRFLEIFVDARDRDEALDLAADADGDEFHMVDGGEWEIVEVQQVEDEVLPWGNRGQG